MIPDEFIDFLKTCTDMELVALQSDARQVGDEETKAAALKELGRRESERNPPPLYPPQEGFARPEGGGLGGLDRGDLGQDGPI